MPRKEAARFSFNSAKGDFIGQGRSETYDMASAKIVGTALDQYGKGNAVRFTIERGRDNWTLNFGAPKGERLTTGVYENALRFPFHGERTPGLTLSGCGRCSNESSGRFVVSQVRFNKAGGLVLFEASFVQRSERTDAPPLQGEISYFKIG